MQIGGLGRQKPVEVTVTDIAGRVLISKPCNVTDGAWELDVCAA